MNDLCIEFHRRGHSRLAAAERLESACVPKYGPGAELRLIEGRVHAHAEISTLLHYIHGWASPYISPSGFGAL